jgi:hypothetical protein
LDGATVTLTAGTTYTYYQVTDTSTGHNGKLILSAGSILRFDNKSGAGFASAATLIEIYCNGTDAGNCAIISADPDPSHLWSMPASTTLIDATKCEFRGYSGSTSGEYWAFDDCLFASSRYVTVDEMVSATGTTMERIPLARMCERVGRHISSRLSRAGLSNSYSDDALRTAALDLAVVDLLTRYRMDGTKPPSLTLGQFSMSDNIDGAIEGLKEEAASLIQDHIKRNRTYRQVVRVVNRC